MLLVPYFVVATFPTLKFRRGALWWPMLHVCGVRLWPLFSPQPSPGPKEMFFVYSSRCCAISAATFYRLRLSPLSSPRPSPGPKEMLHSTPADAVLHPSFSVATLPPLRAQKGLLSYNVNMADAVNSAAFFSGHFFPSRPPKGLPILANAAIIITVFLGS